MSKLICKRCGDRYDGDRDRHALLFLAAINELPRLIAAAEENARLRAALDFHRATLHALRAEAERGADIKAGNMIKLADDAEREVAALADAGSAGR